MQITQSSSYSRLAFALLAGVITLAGIICLHRSPATVVEPVPTKSGEQPVQRAASPATAKKPENTAEQEDRVVFRDEFQRDSRDQYKITGPVEWEKGKLTLAAGASLEKKISTVPKLDIAFQTVWPPLEKEGDTSRLEITVWNAGSNSIVAVFERCRKEGRNAAELAIVQRTANPRPGQGLRAEPEDTMVRRFSTASDFSSGMIRIHFVFGLLSVTADGEELATGFVRVSGQENQSMVLHSARLGCRVVQIAIEGDRPRRLTENEKRSAELALRTSQEANWFYARGNYPRAELLARQAVEIKKKVLGENHPDYAVSLGDLAAMLHA
ncbi:MAG: tetratricopeptide repeat protein, partial [Thermoguttaceae bacterium]